MRSAKSRAKQGSRPDEATPTAPPADANDIGSQAVLDALTARIAVLDRNGRVLAVNPAWRRFAAQQPASALARTQPGEDYLEVCRQAADAGEAAAGKALPGLTAVLRGAVDQFTLEFSCESGTLRHWCLLVATPLGQGGAGAVVSQVDVTSRKHAEATLRDREDWLAAILTAAIDAIITIDGRGLVQSFNSAAERMFGYRAEEILGQNVSLLMPTPYREEHDSYLQRYLATREPHIIGIGREAIARRKDGSLFPIALSVSQIDHRPRFTGIIRDISEQKDLQRQVLEAAAEEQRRIGQELHDHTQQQLTGLGLIAHSLSEKLAADESAEDGRCALASRLASGINETLRHVQLLSRGLIPVEIDAHGLMAALRQLAESVSQLHRVECRFHCAHDVELADNFAATHLYRVAQEAVTNAVKHSRAQRIGIELSKVGQGITLRVVDDGVGIGSAVAAGPGMGLQIMGYRASLIHGVLRVGAANPRGTEVSCTISQEGPTFPRSRL